MSFKEIIDSTHAVENHREILDGKWVASQANPFVKSLREKDFSEIVAGREDYREAFLPEGEMLKNLRCADGREEISDPLREGKLAEAGQCILYSDEELDKFVAENKGKIKSVCSHVGCGAAKIKYDQMLSAGLSLPAGVTTSDELGVYFSKQLAERLGAQYGHTGPEELRSQEHDERALILAHANFDASKIKDFPAHFSSHALTLNDNVDYIKASTEILSGIALGSHGFGSRFTAKNPFYVVVVAQDAAELESIKSSLAYLIDKSEDRIKITGSIAPSN